MNDFGKTLNALRKEKGWTQTELADKLGVTNQAISKWETGDSFPDTALLIPLSELFGITVDSLLKGKYGVAGRQTSQDVNIQTRNNNDDEDIPAIKPPEWKRKFAILLCIGLAFVFAGITQLVVVALVNEKDVLYGTIIMFLLFTAGIPFFVYGGIIDSLYFLDVKDERYKPEIKRFAIKITIGVALCILAATSAVCCGIADLFPEKETLILTLSLSVMFALIFAGVALFVIGGLAFSNVAKQSAPQVISQQRKNHGKGRLSDFSGVVILAATAVFLLLGFLKNLWHPAWVVFPIGGIICAILSVLDDALGKTPKDKK